MSAEDQNGTYSPLVDPAKVDHSLDDLAKELVGNTVSGHQAMRRIGGAFLESVFNTTSGWSGKTSEPSGLSLKCPDSGTIWCKGRCVKNLCPEGQAFNHSTCRCKRCQPRTSPCHSGSGLNICCPPEGHRGCCAGYIQDPTPGLPTLGRYIGCQNSSCNGCVIRATDPGDLLGASAGKCITDGCAPCRPTSGGIGCLRNNPNGSLVVPLQCDPL
jgi:hypothetical protein